MSRITKKELEVRHKEARVMLEKAERLASTVNRFLEASALTQHEKEALMPITNDLLILISQTRDVIGK